MGNSLSDQLLKAGLATKNQAKKIQNEKKKQDKMKRHNNVEVVDEAKVLAEKAAQEQAERARRLNKEKQEVAEKKAIAAQIKQLIEMNRQPRDKADISYNFTDEKAVKQILVTKEMQDQLVRGRLSIAKLGESYEVVPSVVADKIKLRDESSIVLQNETKDDDKGDDPYADFEVPDDLMW